MYSTNIRQGNSRDGSHATNANKSHKNTYTKPTYKPIKNKYIQNLEKTENFKNILDIPMDSKTGKIKNK